MQTFFEKFVTGRGLLPAIRIGQQPYGILPATAFKFWKSKDPQGFPQRLLDQVLKKLDPFWETLKNQVLFAEKKRRHVSADPLNQDLMRLAGTDPASSRFAQQALFGEGYLNLMLRLNLFQYLEPGRRRNSRRIRPAVNQYQGQVSRNCRAKFWELGHFSAFRFMHAYPKSHLWRDR